MFVRKSQTISKYLVANLVSNSVLVTTSKAPVTSSVALVTSSEPCYYGTPFFDSELGKQGHLQEVDGAAAFLAAASRRMKREAPRSEDAGHGAPRWSQHSEFALQERKYLVACDKHWETKSISLSHSK